MEGKTNTLSRKDFMGKVLPYHTIILETEGERDVYHDQSECPAGRRIKPEHKSSGTAGRPKCLDCLVISN